MWPDWEQSIRRPMKLNWVRLRIILEEAGSSLDNVLTVTVYLLDIEEYARFNAVYKKYFKENRPARTCIQAGSLPFNTRVEITATAYV
jgi:2-iminobutanoate/2-iminopropanoate deaminase